MLTQTGKRVKVDMLFSKKAYKQLKELSNNIGMSESEVFRRALGFYKLYLNETKEGNRIIIRSGSKDKEIVGA